MEILFSVIMPIYNSRKTLGIAIESILNQEYKYFELILVNDGSTDKSGEICSKYQEKDNRIKIVNKKNGGLSSARNAGLEIAKGKYIQFIDSDDYVEKNLLKDIKTYIDNEDVDLIIYGKKDVIINSSNIKEKIVIPKKSYEKDKKQMYKNFINLLDNYLANYAWNKVYKREILVDKNIKFENKNLIEDLLFNIRYIKCCENMLCIDKYYYNYLHYSVDSLAKRYYEDRFLMNTYLYESLIELYNYSGINEDIFYNKISKSYNKEIVYTIMSLYSSSTSKKYINEEITKIVNSSEVMNSIQLISEEKIYLNIMQALIRNKNIALIKIYSKVWIFFRKILK